MSDIFNISVTALQAFQQAINVTSNNVANASTPGYDKETVNLVAGPPLSNGTLDIGSGVRVTGIDRAFSSAANTQLNTSSSSLAQYTALQNYSTQIDNLLGTTSGGLSTSLQTFYSAFSDVANAPTSTASRQSLLSDAQSLASSFQSTSTELNAMNTDINNHISADVTQINSIAQAISTLNGQIVTGTAQDGGQPPNELLDQRDQLVTNLSKLVNLSTTTESDGSLDVFVGNGQPLVLQGQVTQLTTVQNQFDASNLDISTTALNGNSIAGSITSGDLGGLLQARTQIIQPALNQLGQIATAVSTTVNSQQAQGLDLSGKFGAPIFSVAAPTAVASSTNTDATTATVSISDLGGLTANDYILKYSGGAYTLQTTDGTNVAFTGNGTAGNPITADGVSIVLSGTPANGDQFLVQPTAGAASSFKAIMTDPSQIAAAGAVQASASNANKGTATISDATTLDAANPNLQTPATITFISPTTYSINGGATQTYTSGGNIDFNGWEVQISGNAVTGDTFTVGTNASGSGDNRNALLALNQQTVGVLNNGTTSITQAVSGMITGLGSQAQEINTQQTAQQAVNSQAQTSVQSISGVNLDEEAASLLQWQQAYQAAAQSLSVAGTLFQSLLTAVQGA